MAKAKTKSRLEAIREQLKKAKLGKGQEYWKPQQGKNRIRLLPGVGEMDPIFWAEIGQHYIQLGAKKWRTWVCPDFTADDRCPICEYVNELYSGSKADKELAGELRVNRGWAMNIIDREAENKGPQIFVPGVTIMRQIQALLSDDEYGDLIIDVDSGLDLTITRSGKQRNTTYNVTANRRESPLSSDPAQIDEWLDAAVDLTPVGLTEDASEDAEAYKDDSGATVAVFGIAPYERIKYEFENVGDEEEEGEEEEYDEEEYDEEEYDEEDEDEEDDDGDSQEVRDIISKRRKSARRGGTSSTSGSRRSPRRR